MNSESDLYQTTVEKTLSPSLEPREENFSEVNMKKETFISPFTPSVHALISATSGAIAEKKSYPQPSRVIDNHPPLKKSLVNLYTF